MPETVQVTFSYQEVVEALLKKQGIHEGIWQISVKFGLTATNVGPNPTTLTPSAVLGILEIGLQKADTESNIALDAAKANPKPPTTGKRSK